jgi:hypothetical protein
MIRYRFLPEVFALLLAIPAMFSTPAAAQRQQACNRFRSKARSR